MATNGVYEEGPGPQNPWNKKQIEKGNYQNNKRT